MNSFTELAADYVNKAYTQVWPRYLLLVDATPEEEKLILESRRGIHRGTIQWLKLKDGIFYTYDTHGKQMQDEFICDILKHRRFLLSEIFLGSFRYTGSLPLDENGRQRGDMFSH
jgi:hypothetical protein